MKTSSLIFKNDKGSVIVVGMMILVLLTIIGIAAINTGTFESQIIGNEHRYQIDFYVADSGWKEAAMWLEDSGAPPAKVNSGTDNTVRNFGTVNYSLSQYTDVGYDYQIEKIRDDPVSGSGSGWREFFYKANSRSWRAASQTQEIEVTVSKIFKVGY